MDVTLERDEREARSWETVDDEDEQMALSLTLAPPLPLLLLHRPVRECEREFGVEAARP